MPSIFAAFAASALLSLALLSLLFAIAGLAYDNANQWLKLWQTQGRIEDVAQWNVAYSRLALARRLNPLNADYNAALGHLMTWKTLGLESENSSRTTARRLAEDYYLGAVQRRPVWGYTWANLAESRFQLGLLDTVYLDALDMAMSLAPWEPLVQRKVAWLGMATWKKLPERSREEIRESVRRTVIMGRYSNEIVRLAIQYDWLHELKPMLQNERQRRALDFVFEQLNSQ